MSTTQAHWQAVYRDKSAAQTSWFRAHLDESLRLIDALPLDKSAPVIDAGGGRATLVDDLLARGFTDVTVLDIAEPALADARARLGVAAARVHWVAADVLEAPLPDAHFGLWHDRAVFHFLTHPAPRRRYVARMAGAVSAGGHAIVATFASDGPARCSGLDVQRFDADELAAQFTPMFERIAHSRDVHRTPWHSEQAFTYVVLRRTSAAAPAAA